MPESMTHPDPEGRARAEDEHREWCSFECPAFGDEREHRSDSLIANRGGPLADPETPLTVDRTVCVCVEQDDLGLACVVMQPELWLRLGRSWGIPGELVALLPPVRMTATRTRHLIDLLARHAAMADEINDRAPAVIS